MFCFPSFNPDPTIQYTFWTLSIGGALTAMPVWTVSQTAVQRYMSVKMVSLARRWDSADIYHTAVITQEWWVKIPKPLPPTPPSPPPFHRRFGQTHIVRTRNDGVLASEWHVLESRNRLHRHGRLVWPLFCTQAQADLCILVMLFSLYGHFPPPPKVIAPRLLGPLFNEEYCIWSAFVLVYGL